ncbi:MAG TPA: ATP synthase F1 subunit delta [Thermoguttaceae bacterium]|nr:ATP synthase F1 subunit delta [Thermoguttaceae bacterium]
MADDNLARDAQQVAQMEADVGRLHIGAVYAEAFLAAAQAAGATDAMVDTFDAVVADVLDPFPEFERVLASILISHEEKIALLDRVFGPRVPPLFLNFLKVVSRHDRMDCLRAIHAEAHSLHDKLRHRVQVELVTPVAVDDAAADRLAAQLTELIGGEPIVTRRVDPALIGGATIRVGDTIYDGSVATQLRNLCQQMIDRSADEIQSRRDRFRYPA